MDTVGKNNRGARGQTKIDKTFHQPYKWCANTFALVMLTTEKIIKKKKESKKCKSRFIFVEQTQKYSIKHFNNKKIAGQIGQQADGHTGTDSDVNL